MSKEKSFHRKFHILQTASRLIVGYGFDKTTTEDIAHESGVSKGSLYLIWLGKDAFFDSLIINELKQLPHDFQNRMHADPDGGQIAHLYKHGLLALQNNPLICALYTSDPLHRSLKFSYGIESGRSMTST